MDPPAVDLEAEESILDACSFYSSGRVFKAKRSGAGLRASTAATKAPSKAAIAAADSNPQMGAFFPIDDYNEEADDSMIMRRYAYEQAVRSLGESAEALTTATHWGVFQEAATFLSLQMKESYVNRTESHGSMGAATLGAESLQPIPTVLLYTGVLRACRLPS